MDRIGRIALGSIAGGALAAAACPGLRPFFPPVEGGVGFLTELNYPKGWDYAVVALLAIGSFLGGALVAWLTPRAAPPEPEAEPRSRRRTAWATAIAVFVVMFFVHDVPHQFMDPFHEGEHLVPGLLFREGARPYADVFLFHGYFTDGGLDALVLGDPPSPRRVRRVQTLMSAAAVALLVPIAAELTVTAPGLVLAVFAAMCGVAAPVLQTFPYHRLVPLLVAVMGLLRYARRGGSAPLFVAFASGTLGLLWSLDAGTYTIAGTGVAFVAMRVLRLEARPLPLARVALLAAGAGALLFAGLFAVGADVFRFFHDSFVIMPGSLDAVWSLPAPEPLGANGIRYYVPPLFYGFLLAAGVSAWRRGSPLAASRLIVVASLSLFLFRAAAGRADANHTRYAVPLLGIAVVAFVVEPLARRRPRWVVLACVIPLILYFEMVPSVTGGWKLVAEWRDRQRLKPWFVTYPFRTARTLYTAPANSTELKSLAEAVERAGEGPILDFTNERALYYLFERKPATRCFDIPMLSVPALRAEAMAQLRARPPVCVILGGNEGLANFDRLSNARRVPELAAWIDANYRTRTQFGRFVLATR